MSEIKVNVSLTDIDLFREVLSILEDFSHDERISKYIRYEYKSKIELLMDKE